MSDDLLALACDTAAARGTFRVGVVVRCERPPREARCQGPDPRGRHGDGLDRRACAEPIVVREAVAALRDGQPRFVSWW